MVSTETKRVADFPLFDWLRIAMALQVAGLHFGLIPWPHAGNLAVQVFFALSGWLIGSILVEMNGAKLPLFYFNRTTRVWLPYFAAIAMLYGLSAFRDTVNARWLEFLLYDVTFTHNLFSLLPNFEAAHAAMPLKGTGNHFWSLSVEEQFYLFSPIVILFMPGGKRPALWAAIGIVALFFRQEFSAIAFGVAAAATHHAKPDFQRGKTLRAVLMIVLIASGIGVSYTESYELASPILAISIVLLLAVPGKRSALGRFVGGVSYPLYLNHWIALIGVSIMAKRLGGNTGAWVAGGMVLAVAIGIAAYLAIDRPVLGKRRNWYDARLGWALAAASYALVCIGLIAGITLRVA